MTASSPLPRATPHQPRRRLATGCGLVLGGLLLLLLLGRFTPILHPTLGSLISWGSARYGGLDLNFADLDTDWTTFLELSEVEMGSREASHPLKSLTAQRVRIDFRLRDLLAGNPAGLQKLTAHALKVDAVLQESPEEKPSSPWPQLPSNLPKLDVEPFEIHMLLGEGKGIDILEGSLQVKGTAQGERLALQATSVKATLPGQSLPAVPLSAALTYRQGLVEVEHLTLGRLGLDQGSFLDGTDLQSEKLHWNLNLLAGQSGGPVTGSLEEGLLSSNLDLQVELQEVAQLLPQAGVISGQVQVQGELSFPLDRPGDGNGQFTVVGTGLLLQGISVAAAQGEIQWRNQHLEIPQLSATGPDHRLQLTQALLPLTGKDPRGLLSAATGELELQASGLHTLLASRGVSVAAEPPPHQLQLSASLGQGALHLHQGFLRVEGGAIEVLRGEVKLLPATDGSGATPPPGPAIDLDLEAQFQDLAPLGRLVGSTSWGGSLQGSLRAQGSWPHLQGTADLVGEKVQVAGFALGTVQLKAQSDGLDLQVGSLDLSGGWGTLQASGKLHLQNYHLQNVRFEADVRQAALLQPGVENPSAIPDKFRLEAQLDGPWRQATGFLRLKGSGSLGALPSEDISFVGQLHSGDLEIETLSLRTPYGEVEAAGTLGEPLGGFPLRLTLSQLSLRSLQDGNLENPQKARDLTLQQPAQLQIGARGVRTPGLDLRGSAGALQIRPTLQGGVDSPLEMIFDALDPMPFVGSSLPSGWTLSDLSGQALLDWRSDALNLETRGTAGLLRIPAWERDLVASWQGDLATGVASLDNLTIRDDRDNFLRIHGELPIQDLIQALGSSDPSSGSDGGSPLNLRGELRAASFEGVPLDLGGDPFEMAGDLRGKFEVGGQIHQLRGRIDLTGQELKLSSQAPGTTQHLGPGVLEAHLKLDGETGLSIEELRLDITEAFHLEASGGIALPADLSAYRSSKTLPSPWQQASVKVDCRFHSQDLSWARSWLTGVRRLEGTVEGSLEARGSLGQPQLKGFADLSEGSVRLVSSGLAVDALGGRVSFDPDSVDIESLGGELGGSPFSLVGSVALGGRSPGGTTTEASSATLEPKEEASPVFDLRLTGDNLLLARDADLRLRSDVDLLLQGPLEALRLSGALGLRNTRLRQQIDLLAILAGGVTSTLTGVEAPASSQGGIQLFSFPDPPLSTTRLDLRVRSVEPIQLTGNLAKGGARVDLRIQGTGEVPLPVGTIYVEPTEIRLPSGAAKLSSGTIVFSQGKPFSPEMAVGGTTRMQGYDIGIQLTGPVEQPEVLLSSTPPLPNDELLLLVLTGQPPTSTADGLGERRAAESVALYLARDFLVRWMGKGSQQSDSSWLDRFELVRGRDVSETGVETTEVSFRLEKGMLHNSDVLYLVAEQDTFEDYNFGLRLVFRFQ